MAWSSVNLSTQDTLFSPFVHNTIKSPDELKFKKQYTFQRKASFNLDLLKQVFLKQVNKIFFYEK